jgi:hypothetical protein
MVQRNARTPHLKDRDPRCRRTRPVPFGIIAHVETAFRFDAHDIESLLKNPRMRLFATDFTRDKNLLKFCGDSEFLENQPETPIEVGDYRQSKAAGEAVEASHRVIVENPDPRLGEVHVKLLEPRVFVDFVC